MDTDDLWTQLEQLLARADLQSAEPLRVAVFGSFARGKSVLFNTLLGWSKLLPVIDGLDEADLKDVQQLLARVDQVEVVLAAEAIASEPQDLEALDEVFSNIRRADLAKLSRVQLLLLVLTWLIALGLPLAQLELPEVGQTLINSEVATVALALVITDKLKDS